MRVAIISKVWFFLVFIAKYGIIKKQKRMMNMLNKDKFFSRLRRCSITDEFKGSHVWTEHFGDTLQVYNYSTLIALKLNNTDVLLNNRCYSRTTGINQNKIRYYCDVIFEGSIEDILGFAMYYTSDSIFSTVVKENKHNKDFIREFYNVYPIFEYDDEWVENVKELKGDNLMKYVDEKIVHNNYELLDDLIKDGCSDKFSRDIKFLNGDIRIDYSTIVNRMKSGEILLNSKSEGIYTDYILNNYSEKIIFTGNTNEVFSCVRLLKIDKFKELYFRLFDEFKEKKYLFNRMQKLVKEFEYIYYSDYMSETIYEKSYKEILEYSKQVKVINKLKMYDSLRD